MLVVVAAPPLPRLGGADDEDGSSAEPPPRRDWLELYGRLVPPAPPPPRPLFLPPTPARTKRTRGDDESGDADADGSPDLTDDDADDTHHLSPLQQRLPDEVLLNVLSRLGGPDAPYALARVALTCRHFRLLASAPMLWERACYLAFTAPAFQAGFGRRLGGGGGGAMEAASSSAAAAEGTVAAGSGDVRAVSQAIWGPATPHHHHPHGSRRRRALPTAAATTAPPPVAAAFASGPAAVHRLLATRHQGSWRTLYLSTPRPRSDGLYVSRNTYVRVGVRELRSASGNRTCHLVAYFRYFLFLPATGRLVYRTSPLPPARVAKGMARLGVAVERGVAAAAAAAGSGWWAGDGGEEDDEDAAALAAAASAADAAKAGGPQQQQPQQQQHALVGKHAVRGSSVLCAVTYPNARRTEIRTRLELRCAGAGFGGSGGGDNSGRDNNNNHTFGSWNRLDIKSIESFDREDGTSAPLDGARRGGQDGYDDEDDDEDDALWQAALGVEAAAGVSAEARRAHRRGLNPAVFVPWGEVLTTRLNDPPSKMDVFIPG